MAEVIERQEEKHELPVQKKTEREEAEECPDLEHAPDRVAAILAGDLAIDHLGIVPKITEKDVAPDVFGLALVPVPVDRQPVDRLARFVGPVAVAHVVPLVNVFVECLGETHGEGLDQAEDTIQQM